MSHRSEMTGALATSAAASLGFSGALARRVGAVALSAFVIACGPSDGSDDDTGYNPSPTGGTFSTGGVTSLGGNTQGGSPVGGAPTATGGAGGSGGATGGTAPGSGGSGGAPPATGGTAPGGAGGSGGISSSGSGGIDSSGGMGGSAGMGTGGSGGVGGVGGIGGMDNTGGSPQAGTGGTGSGSVTCPSTPLKAGDSTRMVQVGSGNRSYELHVPASYDGTKPVPLVVDFHPLTGSGPAELKSSPYRMPTDAEGVITAFPSGLRGPAGNAWNVGPCCVKDVDDVAFARALVADIQKIACIDPKRIYAVGFSMGGGMSHYLACHAADLFAAVAPAAFDLLEENVGDCKPSRPISVISFRGTSDFVVPYEGGYSAVVQGMPITFLGAEGTFKRWAQINECTGAPAATGDAGCQAYTNCKDGVEVVLCTIQGGDHEPGNASIGWPFLKKFVMP